MGQELSEPSIFVFFYQIKKRVPIDPCEVSRLIRTFLVFDYANRFLVIVGSITTFVD